ncbi:MAG: glycosyltransferase family protein [Hasllibacter sp.]
MTAVLPVLPVLAHGVLPARAGGDALALRVEGGTATPLPSGAVRLEAPGDVTLRAGAARARIVRGAGAGAITHVGPGLIEGRARVAGLQEAVVLAFDAGGLAAHAVARGPEGRFAMVLPAAVARGLPRRRTLGIEGTDCVLAGGPARVGRPAAPPRVLDRARSDPIVAIKIAAPDLQEGRAWGDWHFATALAQAFAREGLRARVDTQDAWYAPSAVADVVLAIRGRHRLRLDRGRINLMWLISHPERVSAAEYAEYDHVAVASEPHAARLRARGLADASVLHQATDARLFGPAGAAPDPGDLARGRLRAALFVGNSRREYRTMVKWCRRRSVPLELYGSGWEGIVPPGAVRAPAVANADLPACYARHMLLLNDHWDSMRAHGFLSNRLFDGGAAGTPIVTDPVAGLEAVFGDTVATASDADGLARQVEACLADPAAWLARAARARDIVLGAHTFDHRARTLARRIARLAAARP